jgi:ATP-dependent Clp protease adapter protein ClpS
MTQSHGMNNQKLNCFKEINVHKVNRNFIASNILEIAILEMCRLKKGESFSPSDVVQWIYPEHWHFFLSEAIDVMMQLHREGKIILLQNNIPLESDEIPNDTLSIQAKTKTS